jgi:hypothetical protein
MKGDETENAKVWGAKGDEPASNSTMLSPTGQHEMPGGGDLDSMPISANARERSMELDAMLVRGGLEISGGNRGMH